MREDIVEGRGEGEWNQRSGDEERTTGSHQEQDREAPSIVRYLVLS